MFFISFKSTNLYKFYLFTITEDKCGLKIHFIHLHISTLFLKSLTVALIYCILTRPKPGYKTETIYFRSTGHFILNILHINLHTALQNWSNINDMIRFRHETWNTHQHIVNINRRKYELTKKQNKLSSCRGMIYWFSQFNIFVNLVFCNKLNQQFGVTKHFIGEKLWIQTLE